MQQVPHRKGCNHYVCPGHGYQLSPWLRVRLVVRDQPWWESSPPECHWPQGFWNCVCIHSGWHFLFTMLVPLGGDFHTKAPVNQERNHRCVPGSAKTSPVKVKYKWYHSWCTHTLGQAFIPKHRRLVFYDFALETALPYADVPLSIFTCMSAPARKSQHRRNAEFMANVTVNKEKPSNQNTENIHNGKAD